MNGIGQRIRELRKKNGLTQQNLADCLGISYKSVSKWECGLTTPDLSMIGPLTKILGVSADELLGLKSDENDKEREKYDCGMRKYYDCENVNISYAWARSAVIDYPDDFRYIEWLAYAEYRLAFEECTKENGSVEFLNEMTDNALRRYETIIEKCDDRELYRKAVIGKITVLRFLERIEEADWSAEFEYPDPNITTASDVLILTHTGRDLLTLIEKESEYHN